MAAAAAEEDGVVVLTPTLAVYAFDTLAQEAFMFWCRNREAEQHTGQRHVVLVTSMRKGDHMRDIQISSACAAAPSVARSGIDGVRELLALLEATDARSHLVMIAHVSEISTESASSAVASTTEQTTRTIRRLAMRSVPRRPAPLADVALVRQLDPSFERWLAMFDCGESAANDAELLECYNRMAAGDALTTVAEAQTDGSIAVFFCDAAYAAIGAVGFDDPSNVLLPRLSPRRPVQALSECTTIELLCRVLPRLMVAPPHPGRKPANWLQRAAADKSLVCVVVCTLTPRLAAVVRGFDVAVWRGLETPTRSSAEQRIVVWCPWAGVATARCDSVVCVADSYDTPAPLRQQPMRCSRCLCAVYCCAQCQHNDWVRHRAECVQLPTEPTGDD